MSDKARARQGKARQGWWGGGKGRKNFKKERKQAYNQPGSFQNIWS